MNKLQHPLLTKTSMFDFQPDELVLADALGTRDMLEKHCTQWTGTSNVEEDPLARLAKAFGLR